MSQRKDTMNNPVVLYIKNPKAPLWLVLTLFSLFLLDPTCVQFRKVQGRPDRSFIIVYISYGRSTVHFSSGPFLLFACILKHWIQQEYVCPKQAINWWSISFRSLNLGGPFQVLTCIFQEVFDPALVYYVTSILLLLWTFRFLMVHFSKEPWSRYIYLPAFWNIVFNRGSLSKTGNTFIFIYLAHTVRAYSPWGLRPQGGYALLPVTITACSVGQLGFWPCGPRGLCLHGGYASRNFFASDLLLGIFFRVHSQLSCANHVQFGSGSHFHLILHIHPHSFVSIPSLLGIRRRSNPSIMSRMKIFMNFTSLCSLLATTIHSQSFSLKVENFNSTSHS